MKIPIKHSNTKHLALIAGTIALVGGVSAPLAAYAHGGDGRGQRGDQNQSRGHGNHHDDKHSRDSSWWGWGKLSAEDFAKHHSERVAKLDKFVSDNKLTVDNGDALKTDVNAKAEVVKVSLTSLETLRTSIGDVSNATAEQRAELRTQSVATFEAYYDYKVSFHDYKVAVKTAAKAAGVNYSW